MNALPARIKACAQLDGTFTLRSGKTSNTYFDKYRFEADPVLLFDIRNVSMTLQHPWH